MYIVRDSTPEDTGTGPNFPSTTRLHFQSGTTTPFLFDTKFPLPPSLNICTNTDLVGEVIVEQNIYSLYGFFGFICHIPPDIGELGFHLVEVGLRDTQVM